MTSGLDGVPRSPGPEQRAEAPQLRQQATLHRGEFDRLALGETELDPPAEDHAGDDLVLARDLAAYFLRYYL